MSPSAVLVVDDDAGMRETLTDILEAAGHETGAAADGETALAMLSDHGYDVVVMDVRMPGRDGVAVLEDIGSPPPSVILMTAYAVEDRLAVAVAGHAFALVQKPFSAPYLLGLVARAASAR